MHIINISSLFTSKGQSCCPVHCNFPKALFVALDHTTEQQSRCKKTRACRTCLVSAVKEAEQRFIMDRILPILAAVAEKLWWDEGYGHDDDGDSYGHDDGYGHACDGAYGHDDDVINCMWQN